MAGGENPEESRKGRFDWQEYSGALDALHAELCELEEAIGSGDNIGEELGDLIFSAVNVARFFNVDPEDALGTACDKFVSRFSRVESAARNGGRSLSDMCLDEMEELYRQAKLEE